MGADQVFVIGASVKHRDLGPFREYKGPEGDWGEPET